MEFVLRAVTVSGTFVTGRNWRVMEQVDREPCGQRLVWRGNERHAMKTKILPALMKAIAIDRFGGVETLRLKKLPVPAPGPGEVLMRVAWAGVGEWDPFEREGGFAKMLKIKQRFPHVL